MVTWRFIDKNVPVYNPSINKCRLCVREKFNIALKTNIAKINSRHEICAHCRHILCELINGPQLKTSMFNSVFSFLVPDDWITPVEAPQDTIKQTVAK